MIVVFAAWQFFTLLGLVFVLLCAAPYVTDYTFFVLHDESSWLGASVTSGILGMVVVVVALKLMGL